MERSVDNIDTASRAPLRAFERTPEASQESDKQYSPGDFLRQFGAVVAICLGLALMAHVLVTLSGSY